MKKTSTTPQIEKLEQKVDKILDKIASIDVTLVGQHMQLKEHLRRSQLNEENIELLREQFKPVEVHVSQVAGALKFLGIISILVGVAAGIIKILEFVI